MATFNKFTYVTRVNEVGTNGAEMAEMILANTPGLELYHIESNTTSRFTAYYKVFGDTAFLLGIDANSSYLYLHTLVRSNSGTTIINGESYRTVVTTEYVNMHARDQAFAFYSLVCDNALLSIGDASRAVTFFKVKNVDTGEIVYCAGNLATTSGSGTVFAADGKGNYETLALDGILPSYANTGYIRAVPVGASAYGSVPTAGYPVNLNLMYKIFSNGGGLVVPIWTEVSVGGVSFISVGNARNVFIRIS